MVRSSFRWRHIVSILLISMCSLSARTPETAAPLRIDIVLFGDSRLADKVIRGVRAGNIPFETPKPFTYTINRTRLRQLSLQLPALARSEIDTYVGAGPQ